MKFLAKRLTLKAIQFDSSDLMVQNLAFQFVSQLLFNSLSHLWEIRKFGGLFVFLIKQKAPHDDHGSLSNKKVVTVSYCLNQQIYP